MSEGMGMGVVTYRCAKCGELIEGQAWFTEGGEARDHPGELKPDTRTYHKEHLPDGS